MNMQLVGNFLLQYWEEFTFNPLCLRQTRAQIMSPITAKHTGMIGDGVISPQYYYYSGEPWYGISTKTPFAHNTDAAVR